MADQLDIRSRASTTTRFASVLALLATLAGCGGATHKTSRTNAVKAGASTAAPKATKTRHAAHRRPTRTVSARVTPRGGAAVALAALPIKGRAPMTGYSRERFGSGWSYVNGCDTRDRILERDLTAKSYLDDCRVESGKLDDPYTALQISYERGGASEVDIDHVVALGDAWQKGARQWSHARRVRFANDPVNLLSVDASANRQKSDADAATWLPPDKRFRCDYVARQVAVKAEYHAWVTQAEHDAIARVLRTCPHQKLPGRGRVRVHVRIHTEPAATVTPQPRRRDPGSSSRHGHVFANCAAARAAGAAPIVRGTAAYSANAGLDGDGDGTACE